MSYSLELITRIVDRNSNPFWTLEALGEQAGSVWSAIDRHDWSMAQYHLKAVREYQRECWAMFTALLPHVFAMSDADTDEEFKEAKMKFMAEYGLDEPVD